MNKKTEFFKKHAVLLIGIVLYLIVYIINCKYDPWEYRSKIGLTTSDIVELYTHEVLPDNSLIEKFPADILFYGVADASVLVENGVFAVLALVTFGMVLMGYWVECFCDKNGIKKFEMIIIDHLYGNILLYILSVVIAKIMDNSDFGLHTILEFLTPENGSGIFIGILALIGGLLVIVLGFCFVMLPMLPVIIYFFGYLSLSDSVVNFINHLDASAFGSIFGETFFPREVLSFIAAFLILAVFNIILERIYSLMQKYSIYPAYMILRMFKRGKNKKIRRDENACKKNNTLS